MARRRSLRRLSCHQPSPRAESAASARRSPLRHPDRSTRRRCRGTSCTSNGSRCSRSARPPSAPRDSVADFLTPPTEGPAVMRYGVLIEVEQYWQSLGVLWGELLYSVSLTPGDEAKLAVLDGRWRREAEGR